MEIKDTGLRAFIWIRGQAKETSGWKSEVAEIDNDGKLYVWHPFKPVLVELNGVLEDTNYQVELSKE